MRAAVFRDFGLPLVLEEIAVPQPAPEEVLIQVGRCGICGSDLHMTREPAFGVAPGTVLGHEFAGQIVDVGGKVTALKVGDHVAVAPLRGCGRCPSCQSGEPAWCDSMQLQGGGYAQYAVAADRQCLKLPVMTSVEDGALVEPLAVALHGVLLAGLKRGARVLILGAGPIGLGVAFWARRLGAAAVVVSDLTTLQSQLAHHIGATAFLKTEASVVADAQVALGGKPDVVFECVGKPGILAQALEHVRPRGSIIMLGLCTTPDSFVPFKAISKEVRFISSAFFSMSEYQTALDTLQGGSSIAKAMVTGTVPLTEMPATFEALRQRTSQCKIMVRPD